MSDLTDNLVRFDSVDWVRALVWIRKNIDLVDTTTKFSGELNDSTILPRTNGDLAIRRLRIKDIMRVLKKEEIDEMRFFAHLDNIMFANICVFGIVNGFGKLRDLRECGIFNSFDIFVEAANRISSHFKRYPICLDDTKMVLCEINCLTGYLQNDPPGWDFEKEFDALGKGGYEHGLLNSDWKKDFVGGLKRVMTRQSVNNWVSLDDYIRSGLWITAGASSIGKVEWSYSGESGKFKARKNMLTELYSDDELISIVRKWDGVLRSRVFTKDELSKRRLAVASNIEAYLTESWILHMFGHGFKNYDYITLDETPKEQHQRSCGVMRLIEGGAFCLPFDFKGFDHQPQIENEVQPILDMVVERVREIVPVDQLPDYDRLSSRMVKSYAKGELINPKTMRSVIQEGGIPSGVRTTSLIGNIWNATMTSEARELTRLVMGVDLVKKIGIKGDDTYIISDNPICLVVFRLAYAAINAIGSDSKFGISQRVCEFLRTEISMNGMRGWTNRAIPSITQRKPWNSKPWSPSSEVGTVADNIYLLERRAKKNLDILHLANKIKWSKFTNQSYLWLHLPVRLGGLGLYRFEGWEPNGRLPPVTKPHIAVQNIKANREYVKWAGLNKQQNEAFASEVLNMTIASDDIPGPQRFYSKDFINRLRQNKYVWQKVTTTITIFDPLIDCPPKSETVYWPKKAKTNDKAIVDGMPRFAQFVREHQMLKNAEKRIGIRVEPLPELATRWYPQVWMEVEVLERNGWHRTDAINIVLGEVPIEPTKILHPLLTTFVQESVRRNNYKNWKGRRQIALNLYSITTRTVEHIMSTGGSQLYAY